MLTKNTDLQGKRPSRRQGRRYYHTTTPRRPGYEAKHDGSGLQLSADFFFSIWNLRIAAQTSEGKLKHRTKV